jgi:thiol-disulfide isomerase/thioredoxin
VRYRIIRILLLVFSAIVLLLATRVTTLRPTHSYPAPDFTLSDLDGKQVHLSAFRGKAVVLNFWATWCAPCRREIPWFIELQKEYGPQGLQVIGVSMDEGGKDAIEPVVQRMGIDYPVLLGDEHVASLYGAAAILPTTYYISRDGKVLAFAKGVISRREVESNIQQALVQRAPTTK